ncbi:MAG: enoyl-CoA hydratase/isomerase family protein [Alphaproteobacteria bacterium]|nr:enoyl-CoA hydratase/isomerase family protein [Alphaproteobacteria bacterium]MCB9930297.1 enoyl-CoA hydratase/isomerase family protein [Alphaproteobacteria bacterium]
MTETVLVEDRGAVRLLTLNRPDKLNAINGALVQDLLAALAAAHGEDSVASVVLTGSGRAFSAGADMKEAQSHAGRSQREHLQASGGSTALYEAIMAIDKPVIAAISGYALGGGCALVMASDIVVAGESAVLGYPEVKRGLAATAVTPTLVAQVGRKWASELLLLSENITAARAAEIGLVNRVVPDGEVLTTALAMAETLAGYAHDALWMTKRMIRRSADLSLDQAHGLARDSMLVMRGF